MRRLVELSERLRGSWWTVVAAIAIGLAGAMAVLPHLPRLYEAEIRLRIVIPGWPDEPASMHALDGSRDRLRASFEKPDHLLQLWARTTGGSVEDPAAEAFARRVLRNTTWTASRDSDLAQVTLRAGSPDRAVEWINGLARIAVAAHAAERVERARESQRALDDRALVAKTEFDAVDEELRSFEGRHRPDATASRARLEGAERKLDTNLEQQALTIDQIEALQARIEQTESGVEPAPATLPSDQRVIALESDLAELRLRYSERHPTVSRKRAELVELLAELAPRPTPTARPARPKAIDLSILQQDLREADENLDRLRVEAQELRREIVSMGERIAEAPGLFGRLEEIEARHRSLEQSYREERNRAEEARATLEEERVEVVAWALPSARPSSPGPGSILALGILTGLTVFVGPIVLRHVTNPLVLSAAGLGGTADVPVLPSIPPLIRRTRVKLARARLVKNLALSLLALLALVAAVATLPR